MPKNSKKNSWANQPAKRLIVSFLDTYGNTRVRFYAESELDTRSAFERNHIGTSRISIECLEGNELYNEQVYCGETIRGLFTPDDFLGPDKNF